MQFSIAMALDIGLIPILVGVWLYIGLMTKEFFVPDWLRRTPIVYLFSHMLIMPMITFYVSAFDWLCDCRAVPQGLSWLLVLSFCCGLVLELGRKIRIPEHERRGVETYSGLWGTDIAVSFWVIAVVAAVTAYILAVHFIADAGVHVPLAVIVLFLAFFTAICFPQNDEDDFRQLAEKLIEPSSGLVALLLYGGLGPLQALLGQS